MKVVFYFFLSANIAFFLWQSMTTPGKTVSIASLPLPAGVKKLALVDEGKDPVAKNSGTEGDKKTSKPQEQTIQELLANDAAAESEPEPEPKPAPKAKKEPAPAGGSNALAVCYALGPFEAQAQVKSISAKLLDLGAQANDRKEKLRVPIGYWVHLPRFDSWNEARRKVMELEKLGLADIFIMGRGRMKNAVSLGLFKEEDAAKKRLAKIESLGVNPKMEIQYTVDERYWIDIEVESGKKQVVSAIEAIAKGLTILDLVPRKCG